MRGGGTLLCARTRLIFILMLLLLLIGFNVFFGKSEGADILITDVHSCDVLGNPQYYFPRGTTAYFNISITNLGGTPKNISIYLSVQDELDVPIGSDKLSTNISSSVSSYYIMNIFIVKWAYVGVATAYVFVSVGGTPVDNGSTQFYIGGEDLSPPLIHILSPENTTYRTESVPLTFTVNETTAWMGYSLNGMKNVTLARNTTLTGLANGSYSIIVYANDTSGNMGCSKKVYFTLSIIHDVAVIDLTCSSLKVYEGQTVNITALVQNEGTVTESFNVTTYINIIAIQTLTATNLFPNNQTAMVFTWNTTGWTKGAYTISAYAHPVQGETHTADNTYIDDIVNILPRPDIAVTNVTASKTLIGQGYCMLINVTVKNQGDYIESFNVTAYANATRIQTKTITLASRNTTTVTFTWNTTSFAKGGYVISAYAWPVPDETHTVDNTFVDGTVQVSKKGDANGDNSVDVLDLMIVARALGTHPSDPKWNPNADVDNDGEIDVLDLILVAKYLGT
jgi:hypothetical protein